MFPPLWLFDGLIPPPRMKTKIAHDERKMNKYSLKHIAFPCLSVLHLSCAHGNKRKYTDLFSCLKSQHRLTGRPDPFILIPEGDE